jgi:hypothetical protein
MAKSIPGPTYMHWQQPTGSITMQSAVPVTRTW